MIYRRTYKTSYLTEISTDESINIGVLMAVRYYLDALPLVPFYKRESIEKVRGPTPPLCIRTKFSRLHVFCPERKEPPYMQMGTINFANLSMLPGHLSILYIYIYI